MRARGAQVTDIVILVIAANDGVKPQKVESIRHIKEADVPMIVAINKIDLDSADPETVKSQLAEHEVFCEGFGGQVPTVNLSAKTGQGIPELLDMILLVAQMQELTSHPEAEVNAVVIESSLDKHRGSVATAIVKTGTLKAGDTLYVMEQPVRIRQLLDDHRQPTTQALQVAFDLADGQEREIVFRLGLGGMPGGDDASQLVQRFRGGHHARHALEAVWQYWNHTLGALQVDTPDQSLNVLANGWLLYQTLTCRMWARSGYYQSGGAFGFRDQLQDAMALVHAEPRLLRAQLLLCPGRQFREGDVQHWWHPPSGRGVRTHCSTITSG